MHDGPQWSETVRRPAADAGRQRQEKEAQFVRRRRRKGGKKWTKDTSSTMVNRNVSGNVERKAERRRCGLTDMTFFHCGLASKQ